MRRHTRGLGSSPVARHYWGNHCLFSFPGGTKMFQFPPFAFHISGMPALWPAGCPIRRFRGQGIFAPNPDFSQLITSFFASVSQGIRHAPLSTFSPCNRHYPSTESRRQLILSAVISCLMTMHIFIYAQPGILLLQFFVLCQYVKDLSLMVENNGFEPLTPCLQSRCSSQLS